MRDEGQRNKRLINPLDKGSGDVGETAGNGFLNAAVVVPLCMAESVVARGFVIDRLVFGELVERDFMPGESEEEGQEDIEVASHASVGVVEQGVDNAHIISSVNVDGFESASEGECVIVIVLLVSVSARGDLGSDTGEIECDSTGRDKEGNELTDRGRVRFELEATRLVVMVEARKVKRDIRTTGKGIVALDVKLVEILHHIEADGKIKEAVVNQGMGRARVFLIIDNEGRLSGTDASGFELFHEVTDEGRRGTNTEEGAAEDFAG